MNVNTEDSVVCLTIAALTESNVFLERWKRSDTKLKRITKLVPPAARLGIEWRTV